MLIGPSCGHASKALCRHQDNKHDWHDTTHRCDLHLPVCNCHVLVYGAVQRVTVDRSRLLYAIHLARPIWLLRLWTVHGFHVKLTVVGDWTCAGAYNAWPQVKAKEMTWRIVKQQSCLENGASQVIVHYSKRKEEEEERGSLKCTHRIRCRDYRYDII